MNASFTFRHAQRYPCYLELRRHAAANPNATFVAVSFHTSFFIPRYAGPSPPNVKWVVMEPPGRCNASLPMPYVVDKHGWPAQPRRIPWRQRKLLFFAGHISRAGGGIPTGGVRRALVTQLDNGDPRVTVNAQYCQRAVRACQPLGGANRSSQRLTMAEYVQAAHAHRFCVVSPGDTPSTRKLAETMVLAAQGACLPLFITGTFLPYSDVLNYSRVGVMAPIPRSGAATDRLLERLDGLDQLEADARMQAARGMRHAFLQPEAAHFALRRFGVTV